MNGPLERSRLAAVAFSGSYVGTVLALPVSGLLAQHLGWEWIFYFFGILGLVWCIGWMYIVKDNPEEDRNITDQELEYLRTGEEIFLIASSNISRSNEFASYWEWEDIHCITQYYA